MGNCMPRASDADPGGAVSGSLLGEARKRLKPPKRSRHHSVMDQGINS
jgi:hypothetical protein